jgi:hypothetical protein
MNQIVASLVITYGTTYALKYLAEYAASVAAKKSYNIISRKVTEKIYGPREKNKVHYDFEYVTLDSDAIIYVSPELRAIDRSWETLDGPIEDKEQKNKKPVSFKSPLLESLKSPFVSSESSSEIPKLDLNDNKSDDDLFPIDLEREISPIDESVLSSSVLAFARTSSDDELFHSAYQE